MKDLPLLDCVKPVVMRNNRWRCDHGWDIDLDDGSTNYRLYNNLCLNGGIKLREGSPALKLGFKNFGMDQFGVRKPELRAIARTPVLPGGSKNPTPGSRK